jgi:hypothetical protein
VDHHSEAFVGIDTSRLRNAVAVAEEGRGGDVRYLGEIDTTEAAKRKLVAKLAAKYLTFCYEAGPTGYGPSSVMNSRRRIRPSEEAPDHAECRLNSTTPGRGSTMDRRTHREHFSSAAPQ